MPCLHSDSFFPLISMPSNEVQEPSHEAPDDCTVTCDISERQGMPQAALIFLWVVELTGLALLLEEFGLKLHDNDGAFRNRSWTIVNVVFGSICFVLLSCALLTYAVRSYKAHSLGKRWCGPAPVCPR